MENNELKQSPSSSEEGLARYANLYDFAPVGYVALKNDAEIALVNRAAGEMLGVERGALLGKRFDTFVSEADHPTFSTLLRKVFTTRRHQKCRVALVRKDQPPLAVRIEATLSPNGNECLAVVLDITEEMQAEQALVKSAILDLINKQTSIVICVKDCRGHIVFLNPAMARFIGKPTEELIGKCDLDLVANASQAARIMKNDRRIMETGQTECVEESGTSHAGPWTYLFIKAPYSDRKGNVIGVMGVGIDITDRKRIEEEFRTLCEFAPIGIFRSDGEDNNIYCNPRWEKITGMSASEGMGKGWLRGVHPDDRERLADVWQESMAAGRIFSIEHRHVTPQGETVWVRALANPIKSPDGKILGHVGTLEDITELRQAREEMNKIQKLESLGILAGGVAHDFNNILTAILGNIALAGMRLHDPEKATQRLKEAEKATVRAKELTQQLLTFARGGEPVKKVIDVRGVLKEAAEFALHGSNVRGEFVFADDIWPVEADEGQLSQVIHNLVLNAVEAMPEGGTVTISAGNLSSHPKGKKFVRISVADTGVGIPEHHQQKIFDPYFTTKQHGNGLGLASCYSIVRKHDGRIRATSALGKGSCFLISLPATSLKCTTGPSAPCAVSRSSGSVLVMDDEEPLRDVAKTILEEFGYKVECAETGVDAAELYRQRKEQGTPFSAVILDLTIPGGVGGKEAIKMLLEMDPDVKAIASSGYATDPIMGNYGRYGFSAVLSKPYRPQELIDVLQELLGA